MLRTYIEILHQRNQSKVTEAEETSLLRQISLSIMRNGSKKNLMRLPIKNQQETTDPLKQKSFPFVYQSRQQRFRETNKTKPLLVWVPRKTHLILLQAANLIDEGKEG